MKKYFLLIFLIIFTIGWLLYQPPKIDTSKVHKLIISTSDEKLLVSETSIDDIQFFSSIVNRSFKWKKDINPNDCHFKYSLSFFNNRDVLCYKLHLNLEQQSGFIIDSQNRLYKLEDNDVHSIMLRKEFEELYSSRQIPSLRISDGTHTLNGTIRNANWYFRKVDSSFYPIDFYMSTIKSDFENIVNYTGNLTLEYLQRPDQLNVKILKNEETIYQSEITGQQLFQPKTDGRLIYELTAIWKPREDSDFYGEVTYVFTFLNDVPVELELPANETHPGEVVTVYLRYANKDENLSLEIPFWDSPLTLFNHESSMFALLPISYYTQPGEYIITLKSRDMEVQKTKIDVLPKEFPVQYLEISEQVEQSTRNNTAYEQFDKYVDPIRQTITDKKMWDGKFIQPVEGRISTEFGMRRFVNNAPTSYRHNGIDIAASSGVPIKATNSGKILLAKNLILTGNTIIIDHGYGILSWYYHMSSLNVKEGDNIEKGQIIGNVGSTGFSTGPHLHFSITVNNIFTNPWTLMKQEPVEF